ncbi:hypothetical protein GGR56DRAFT_650152 [Xylariaceae sp. FL0804]|nr:hypothetical protein GGR56DRAFT_650152 [Xylariaceae sp. FL0804]
MADVCTARCFKSPPGTQVTLTRGASPSPPPGAKRLGVQQDSLWEPGQLLTVKLRDCPSPWVREKVEQYANEWTKHANIHFDFDGEDDANIRVTFHPGSCWSLVGTESREEEPTMTLEPTMNLDCNDDTVEVVLKRKVLHEFGHALGCIHEHQQPKGHIRWNERRVVDFYEEMGWSRETINQNIFNYYTKDIVNSTDFDRHSIMLYPIPRDHTTDGFSVDWNDDLSEADKKFIAEKYPRPSTKKRKRLVPNIRGTARRLKLWMAKEKSESCSC